jgi:peptide deformylase
VSKQGTLTNWRAQGQEQVMIAHKSKHIRDTHFLDSVEEVKVRTVKKGEGYTHILKSAEG